MADTSNKEALNQATFTKEARPTTGATDAFGSAKFGISRFGGDAGYKQKKEARPSTTHSKEALNQM